MIDKFRLFLIVYSLSLASGCSNGGWCGYNQPAYPIGPYPGTGYQQQGYPAGFGGAPTTGPIPGVAPNGQPMGGAPNYSQPLTGYPNNAYPGAYPGAYPQGQAGVPLNQFGPSQPMLGR
jgi:hypothetical protein